MFVLYNLPPPPLPPNEVRTIVEVTGLTRLSFPYPSVEIAQIVTIEMYTGRRGGGGEGNSLWK